MRDVETNVKKAQAENDYFTQIVRLSTPFFAHSTSLQMALILNDACSIRIQADLRRQAAICQFYPTPTFLRDSFVSEPINFDCTRSLIESLPEVCFIHPMNTDDDRCRLLHARIGRVIHHLFSPLKQPRFCFLRRPPYCLPCSLLHPARSGYWFHPSWTMEESDQFELVIETGDNQWTYFGRYSNSPLKDFDMALSEWIALDENVILVSFSRLSNIFQTKQEYCKRIATQELDTLPSEKLLFDTRRRLDGYQLIIPCHVLRCHGFSTELYDHLHDAAKTRNEMSPAAAVEQLQPKRVPSVHLQNIPPSPQHSHAKDFRPLDAPRVVLRNIQA